MGKCVSMCSNPSQTDEGLVPSMSVSAGMDVPSGQDTKVRRGKIRTMGRRSTFKYVGEHTEQASRPGAEKTEGDIEFLADVLAGNQHLRREVRLQDSHIRDLAKMAWKEELSPGQVLMSEGDLSNELFFILQEGSLDIVADIPFHIKSEEGKCRKYLLRMDAESSKETLEKGKTELVVDKGLCIGDRSMIFNQPRLVTATAKEPCTVWAISQADFKIIQRQAMQVCGPRTAAKKTPEEAKLLEEALLANANLQRLVPLSHEHVRQVVQSAIKQELEEGTSLMYEGELNAEAFYIIGDGEMKAVGAEPFEVVKEGDVSYFHRAAHTGDHVASANHGPTVRTVEKGHCFGEISMLHCAPRFATMTALKKTTVWMIDRLNFEIVQMKGAEEYVKNRVKYLEGLDAATNLPHGGRGALAGLMDGMRFHEGEVMLQQGSFGTTLYILYDGKVAVEKDGVVEKRLEAVPEQGTHHQFGEASLLKDKPYLNTVRVTSPTATVLVLQRADFMSVWDQVIEGVKGPSFGRLYTQAIIGRRDADELSQANLTKIGLLSAAAFGPVDLVKHTSTGETYALKRMSKGLVARRGLIASVAQEKEVWEMLSSPFVVKFAGSFFDEQTYSVLLEAALGGDLQSVYNREKLYGSAYHSKHYVAGTVLAIDSLHRVKVAYRNLKPQNILLSSTGQPKLTDMGLAKVVIGKTYTMCGTPQYMAPEVLAGTGHSREVDWWSMGVLAFELMAGYTPFESDHPMKVYSNIMRGIARVELPECCVGELGDLVKLLLKPQSIDRLPMRQGGIQNLMDHSWFSGFDWAAMQQQSLKAPWVPRLVDNTDTRCFSPKASEVPQPVEFENQDSLWEDEFDNM